MFYLLQSLGMFAAAGIIIPVIVHFWNRKQGKTLKVGSISLLAQSYKQQAKSLHLQERLLLLLRCLLILLIAFLLSQPFWEEKLKPSKQQGWILMEKRGLSQTYAQFKTVIDSLSAQQFEFHYFEPGFEKDDIENILKNNIDSLNKANFSYWSLLSSLDRQVPASVPVYLFTPNQLKRFAGNRPQVAMNLKWSTYTPKDSISEWLAKAYMTTADSIRLVTVTSQPSGTFSSYKNASLTSQKSDDYNIQTANNNISVSYQSKQPVNVDTATLAVTIFSDRYANDVSYVKAAFDAIKQYSKRKIKLSIVHNAADILQQQDWLFWLSDQPVSAMKADNIFMYENGKAELTGSSIQTESNQNDDEQVALHKRIPYKPYSAGTFETIWQDGFGEPVLELEKIKAPFYHFYSHFDPSWSDLPWSNAFPQMIFNLLWSTPDNASVSDTRIMDDQQLVPIFTAENKSVVKEKFVKTHDLSMAFWIAAFIIFFIERYISFRIKMEKTNA